jgi:hypothetical protein
VARSLSILTGTNGIFRDIDSEKSFNSCSHIIAVISSAATERYRPRRRRRRRRKRRRRRRRRGRKRRR